MKEPYILFKNIKKARVTSELSQKDLAKRLGLSDRTISAYETGRAIPPLPVLTKIASITKKSLSELVGIEDSGNEKEIVKSLKKIEDQLINQGTQEKLIPRTKVDTFVGVVLLDNQKRIFLIKEEDKYSISLGRWNLPGGSADNNETLTDSAIREIKEETGYDIKVSTLVGCYKCKKGNNSWIYIVFKADVIGKSKKIIDPGVKQGRWFNKDEFLKLDDSRIVHPDMKLVYNIAIEDRGLPTDSVKLIDYDTQ